VSREGKLPLSYAQQRLWFIAELEPESVAYHIPAAVRLKGALDVDAMRRAFEALVARHESLRTRFESHEGEAFQVIEEPARWELPVIDLQGLEECERDAALRRHAEQQMACVFDLERGPLLRTLLLRLSTTEHVLFCTMHHIVSDGWSMGVLVREMGELYDAIATGRASRLEPLPIQYADFAAWQREWLEGSVMGAELAYWKERLTGIPALELPVDRARPRVMSQRGASHSFELSPELSLSLRKLSQRYGATLFMTLLSAWQVLLSRWSGQTDFGIGVPIANRTRQEVEGLIGFFVNTLVLRAELTKDPTFIELLARVRSQSLSAYAHQLVPFERLVSELGVERNLSRSPLFQVMFVLQNAPETELKLAGLELSVIDVEPAAAAFDLTLTMVEEGEVLTGALDYATDLFDLATIERLAGHFETLLEAVVKFPDQSVSELPLLRETEWHQVVESSNRTDRTFEGVGFAHQMVEAQAEKSPDAIAVRCGSTELTYAELERRANQFANHLVTIGVGAEVRVGLLVERSVEMIVGILAVLKAGGAYVPLDPTNPRERLEFILEDSQTPILLAQRSVAEKLFQGAPASVERVVWLDGNEAVQPEVDTKCRVDLSGDNSAYVIYTSGSTGRPKGTLISHRSLANLAQAVPETYGIRASDRVLQFSAIGFDTAVEEIFSVLTVGGTLVLRSDEMLDTARFWPLCESYGVTFVHLQPTFWQQLVEAGGDLPSMARVVVVGGERMFATTVNAWRRKYGNQVELWNSYGPTETTVTVTAWKATLTADELEIPIGTPFPNVRTYVLDEHLEPVPWGTKGELYIGGEHVARGYLNRPRLTAERFVPDPFADDSGARLYRTGDIARLRHDGELEFVGRLDTQLKIRGYRVELGEIESVLGAHPHVQQCVVEGKQEAGEGPRLIGYVVAKKEHSPTVSELRAHLSQSLPEYMIPSVFVSLDAIPLTSNGKVDRRALPDPHGTRPELATEYEAPKTEQEQILARILCELLGLERVGVHDSFFELGGDSISSVQLVARARRHGIGLTVRQVFEQPTIRGQAAIASKLTGQTQSEERASGEAILLPIQRWFFEQDLPEAQHWNQSVVLKLDASLDAAKLKAAVRKVVSVHDAFRLRFKQSPEGIKQTYVEEGECVSFVERDLSGINAEELESVLAEEGTAVQASLSLSEGPLVRAVLFDLGSERGRRLLLVAHHLVMDGVSWRVVLEDLEIACRQLLSREPVELGGRTWSYQRWGQEILARLESGVHDAELAYWQKQLDSKPLPVDFEGGLSTVSSLSSISVELSAEQTRALLQEAGRAYRTEVQELIILALGRTLSEWTQEEQVSLWLEGHGREELFENQDLTRSVGWFTTLFPIRLELAAKTDGEQVRSVKEQLRAIPHKGIGYGLLRYLHPKAEIREQLTGKPAQLVFNYLGQFDNLQHQDSLLRLSEEAVGASQSETGKSEALLEVNAVVFDAQLQVAWTFSENIHQRKTVEGLAKRFVEQLGLLIEHCTSPHAGGYTPSDFPLAKLDQDTQDSVLNGARSGIESLYPLSPMQQGMLFHTLYAPDSGMYFEQTSAVLEGVDVDILESVWRDVVARYAVLRTSFLWRGLREPLQCVHQSVEVNVERHDFRNVPVEELDARCEELLASDRARGFDVGQAPLLRLIWVECANDTGMFVFSSSHLLLDGWSVTRVIGEAFEAYLLREEGAEVEVPHTTPYETYIAWLSKQNRRAAEAFWRARMSGFSNPTPLPANSPFARAEAAPAELTLTLSKAETSALERFAQSEQVTLNNLLQAAWAILLARYAGEMDVAFGVTMSGRPTELRDVEEMVGLFINTIPMRVRFEPATTVRSLLQQVRSEQLAIQAFEWTSLLDIQRWSEVPSARGLFDSIIVFENYPVNSALTANEAALNVRDVRSFEQTNYALTLSASLVGELSITLTPDASFTSEETARLAERLRTMLSALAEDPEQTVFELPLVSEAERRQLVLHNNQNKKIFDDHGLAHRKFEAIAARSAESIALHCGECTLTYGELDRQANQLANCLRGIGVGPDVIVALLAERSAQMVVGILGILKAGGAYLPLDPESPAERLRFMLADSGATTLLTQSGLLAVKGLQSQTSMGRVAILDADGAFANESEVVPDVAVGAEHVAYVIYTSGTTGQPKGTLITHRGLANLSRAAIEAYDISPDDRLLQFSALGFDTAVEETFRALVSGAALILRDDSMLDVTRFWAMCQSAGVTLIDIPTAFWQELVRHGAELPASLRSVIVGGERMRATTLNAWRAIYGGAVELWNAYGPTENTVTSTVWQTPSNVDDHDVSIGTGLPNVCTYILDELLDPVPARAIGELFLGGDQVARGYLNRPRLTAERFVPDPFALEPGARLYRTGDLVQQQNDGQLHFVGRIDSQLKIRGYRVEPGEIEVALSKHRKVHQCVVEAKNIACELKLVAYVVLRDGEVTQPNELRRHLQQLLPTHMIPAAFVTLGALPMTLNGKVDRKALPIPADGLRPNDLVKPVAPLLAVETEIVAIWEEILEVHPIGIYDNFFELGGDSLSAMRLLAKLEKHFGDRSISLAQIFKTPTPASLAAAIEQNDPTLTARRVVPLNFGASGTPFFCVHPLGGMVDSYAAVAKLLAAERPFYGIQAAGLALGEQPFNDMIQMAQAYVLAIREIQPSGPYFLGGWSMGARIAFEMARQLRQAGEAVEALVLFDAAASQRGVAEADGLTEEKTIDRALQPLLEMAEMLGFTEDGAASLIALGLDQGLKHLADMASAAGALPAEQSLPHMRRFYEVVRNHIQAEEAYVPQHYPGTITLIRAAEEASADETKGWAEYAERVLVHTAPGNHETIFEQAPGELARTLLVALSVERSEQLHLYDVSDATEAQVAE
jgi:amino acid adenylation domain-containing protein/non-ribosomal peptide synthase protein (TIGR01720 family)